MNTDNDFFVADDCGFKAYQRMPDGRDRVLSGPMKSRAQAKAWLQGYLEAYAEVGMAAYLQAKG